MKKTTTCPKCATIIETWRNPIPTVDIIIRSGNEIILIKRRNPPYGWALPGGFVDYGESLECAAKRETLEETGLELTDLKQFRAYSDPERDPRQHTISYVFTAETQGSPVAGDDAAAVKLFALNNLPAPLCFDHEQILTDYIKSLD
ncbi:MAG: NUDIX hydrolase [Desulfuromonadales bacterium]|nr:NUDIX hydrolase [Desulfuromonadales bacterium]